MVVLVRKLCVHERYGDFVVVYCSDLSIPRLLRRIACKCPALRPIRNYLTRSHWDVFIDVSCLGLMRLLPFNKLQLLTETKCTVCGLKMLLKDRLCREMKRCCVELFKTLLIKGRLPYHVAVWAGTTKTVTPRTGNYCLHALLKTLSVVVWKFSCQIANSTQNQ